MQFLEPGSVRGDPEHHALALCAAARGRAIQQAVGGLHQRSGGALVLASEGAQQPVGSVGGDAEQRARADDVRMTGAGSGAIEDAIHCGVLDQFRQRHGTGTRRRCGVKSVQMGDCRSVVRLWNGLEHCAVGAAIARGGSIQVAIASGHQARARIARAAGVLEQMQPVQAAAGAEPEQAALVGDGRLVDPAGLVDAIEHSICTHRQRLRVATIQGVQDFGECLDAGRARQPEHGAAVTRAAAIEGGSIQHAGVLDEGFPGVFAVGAAAKRVHHLDGAGCRECRGGCEAGRGEQRRGDGHARAQARHADCPVPVPAPRRHLLDFHRCSGSVVDCPEQDASAARQTAHRDRCEARRSDGNGAALPADARTASRKSRPQRFTSNSSTMP